MAGFYPVDHGDLEHPLFAIGRRQFTRWEAYCWLLDHAAFDRHETVFQGKPVLLDRGQIALSVGSLAKAWRWPKSSVQRFLDGLSREGFIIYSPAAVAGTTLRTGERTAISLLTLCKYATGGTGARTDERTTAETAPYSEILKKANNRRKPLSAREVLTLQPDLLGGEVVALPADDVQVAFDAYRSVARELGLAVPHSLAGKVRGIPRRSELRRRLEESDWCPGEKVGLEAWSLALNALRHATFITSKQWRGGFSLDDMVTREKLANLMAGRYNDVWENGKREPAVLRQVKDYYQEHGCGAESFLHDVSQTGTVRGK